MKPLFLPVVCLVLVACQPAEKASSETNTAATPDNETTTEVMMTSEQKAAGWKPLFNGRDLDGWRTFKNKEQNSWEIISGGVLHCKNFDSAESRADLITQEQYDDFELSFEWKISPQGNSGVMFRVTEEYDEPFFTGPEYQMLDDEGYPGDVKDVHFSGGNYDMHAPTVQAAKPVGEWNSSRLVVQGETVEHWLNGVKVVEYKINSDDWNRKRSQSKWNDVEGYARPATGHIALQDHKQEAWFRNILIRPL